MTPRSDLGVAFAKHRLGRVGRDRTGVCPAEADHRIQMEMATIAQSFGELRLPSQRGMPLPPSQQPHASPVRLAGWQG
jgi:hypothetical protein